MVVAVQTTTGITLLKHPITDIELAEWKQFGDAVFGGAPSRPTRHAENKFELFEFLMDSNKTLSRDDLLKRCANSGLDLEALNDEELLMLNCEGIVASLPDPE
jgi:hypothetical protein